MSFLLIKKYHKTKSILGVCLGMQAIGEVFGGEIENLKNVYHGVETSIKIINHEKLKYQVFDGFVQCL